MPLNMNVSGVRKNITVWNNVAGVWKRISVKHNVAGVWKTITSLVSLPATIDVSDARMNTTSSASFTLNNTGTYSSIANVLAPSGTWLGSGSASSYDCRATIVSGTVTSGVVGTWQNLGTSRGWSKNDSTAGFTGESVTLTLEIRDASSLAVVATATLGLTAFDDNGV
jgi:hypothetical protein